MRVSGLVACKCKRFDKIHYPCHDRCFSCGSREFEEIKPAGNATLLTFTQIFNLPWGSDQPVLLIGIGEFENGVEAMGQVKADSISGVGLGMKTKPSWEPVRFQYGEDVYGLKLEPLR